MLQSSSQQPLPTMHPKGIQEKKNRKVDPRQLWCISKKWFQWAQTIASSPIQKSTKCINFRFLAFFNSNLLIVWLPGLCFISSYESSFLLPLWSSPSDNLKLSSRLKSSENSPNKIYFLTFRLSIFFQLAVSFLIGRSYCSGKGHWKHLNCHHPILLPLAKLANQKQ